MHSPSLVKKAVSSFLLIFLIQYNFLFIFRPKEIHAAPTILFGTLLSDKNYVDSDWNAGIRLAQYDLNWSAYEPSDKNFDSIKFTTAKNDIAALKAKGFQVSLGLGLHYMPSWLNDSTKYPGAVFKNQFGSTTTEDGKAHPNFQFSTVARQKAEEFINQVFSVLGTDFYSIRINPGSSVGEQEYPGSDSAGNANSFWAFDLNAQCVKTTTQPCSGRPSEVQNSPMPGWKPGDKNWNGQTVTRDMVVSWYKWYVKASTQVGDWQERVYKSYLPVGSTTKIVWLMPGTGMRPFDVSRYIDHYLLANSTTYADIGGLALDFDPYIGPKAAVWHWIMRDIIDKTNIQIQISSLADTSLTDGYRLCNIDNFTTSVNDMSNVLTNKDFEEQGTATKSSSWMSRWSAVRWNSYNANLYNLAKTGENPGAHDSIATMELAGDQVKSCGLSAWFYAFDYSLHDTVTTNDDLSTMVINGVAVGNSPVAKINDFARLIATMSPPSTTVTKTPVPLKAGDANSDGKVDGVDYIIWLTNYGQNVSGSSRGDFNSDGKVDGVDYIIWLTNYGR